MTEREKQILLKIIAHCDMIEEYTKDTSDEAGFQSNMLLMDGVSMRILSIGELVKRLSPEFRVEASEREKSLGVSEPTNWKGLAGLRDYVAHDYDNINYSIMYETVFTEIPQLKRICMEMLKE